MRRSTVDGTLVTSADFSAMVSLLRSIKEDAATPVRIDEDLQAFCRYVENVHTPVYLVVDPFSWSRVNCCDLNVQKAVKAYGGRELFGFRIWSIPRKYIEADLHCVWEKPNGNVVDITPNPDNGNRTLFLPEPKFRTVRLRSPGHKPRLALDPSLQVAVAMITEAEMQRVCMYPPDDVLWKDSLSYKQLKRENRKRQFTD